LANSNGTLNGSPPWSDNPNIKDEGRRMKDKKDKKGIKVYNRQGKTLLKKTSVLSPAWPFIASQTIHLHPGLSPQKK
jgi:hypothetical protein